MTATGVDGALALLRRTLGAVHDSPHSPSVAAAQASDLTDEDLHAVLRAVSGRGGAAPSDADAHALRAIVTEHAGAVAQLADSFGVAPKELLVQIAIGAVPGDLGDDGRIQGRTQDEGRVHDGWVHDGWVHDGPVHDSRVHDSRVHDGLIVDGPAVGVPGGDGRGDRRGDGGGWEDWAAQWGERWATENGAVSVAGIGRAECDGERVVCLAAVSRQTAGPPSRPQASVRGPTGVEVMGCAVPDDPDTLVVATRLLEQAMSVSGVKEAAVEVRPDRDGPFLQVRLRAVNASAQTERVRARLEAWRQAIEQMGEERGTRVRVRWLA